MFLDTVREEVVERLTAAKQSSNFIERFRSPGLHVIAEIKRASPSQGDIAPDIDVVTVAGDYIAGGAMALSVLTEPNHFKGDIAFIDQIKAAHPAAAILRKDFILDDYQLYEAKMAGADAVLLIVALTGKKKTKALLDKAHELGLASLVEVHDREEMETALAIGAGMIGVNNRNLKTLAVSLDVSRALAEFISDERIFICESGLDNPADIKEMAGLGYKGFLIGTHFMKSGAPGKALKTLLDDLR